MSNLNNMNLNNLSQEEKLAEDQQVHAKEEITPEIPQHANDVNEVSPGKDYGVMENNYDDNDLQLKYMYSLYRNRLANV